MNSTKRKALDAMATGAPLYIYVEPSPHRIGDCRGWPMPGSGTILSDDGPMAVSSRIVAAIENLGTTWCAEYKALVLTETARLRVRGWYAMPEDVWLPD
jgi:hypothetical protein